MFQDRIKTVFFSDNAKEESGDGGSAFKKILQRFKWVFIAFAFFVFFTWLKLPEARFKALINGHLSAALSQVGITYSARETDLSIGFGLTYTLQGVSLYFPDAHLPIRIDEVVISPVLWKALTGRVAAQVTLTHEEGEVDLSLSASPSSFSLSFDIDDLDLDQLRLFQVLADVRLKARVNGSGNLEGELNNLRSLSGEVDLTLRDIVFQKQTLKGFKLPEMKIAKWENEIRVSDGNARLKKVQIGNKTAGKSGKDDLIASLTGDIKLGRSLPTSTIDLKANFELSDNVLKSFVLLDALLGAGKQKDGSYSYKISGRLTRPFPSPIQAK